MLYGKKVVYKTKNTIKMQKQRSAKNKIFANFAYLN